MRVQIAVGLLILCGASARADIVDSGNLVMGGTATIQGNAFSVGASTLVVGGGRVGLGTSAPGTMLDVNGSAQFGGGASKSSFSATGSLSLANNAVIVGNSSITASAFFGDGSDLLGVGDVSTTANNSFTGTNTFGSSVTFSGGVFGTINASTRTQMSNNLDVTSTSLGTCVAQSTITLATKNIAVDLIANLQLTPDLAAHNCQLGFLVDGAFVENYSATVPWALVGNAGSGNSVYFAVTRYHRTPSSLSAGSHSFCLTIATDSGGSPCHWRCSSSARCTFEVREVR